MAGFSHWTVKGAGHEWYLRLPSKVVFYLPITIVSRFLHEQRHQIGEGTWRLLRTHDLIALSTGISTKQETVPDTVFVASKASVPEFLHFDRKDEIMKLRDNQISTGIRTALFLIGTGILITLASALEVSQAGAAPAVVTDLSSQESGPLDRTAREAIGKSQLQTRTIVRVRHVKLDVASILNNQSITMNFFANVSLVVAQDKVTQTTDGTTNWVGHVGTNKINRAIFAIKDGKIVGTVHKGIHVYQIRPIQSSAGGIHTIYEIDQTRFPSERAHGKPPRRSPVSSNPSPGEIGSHAPALSRFHSSTSPITTVSLPGSTQVDLLVVYGDDVKNAAGANIDMEILQAVNGVNQTLEYTGIALFLCLVDRVYVPGYRGLSTSLQTNSLQTDFDCLVYDLCPSQTSIAKSTLIRSMRDSRQVDLVSAWVEEGNDCGWAYPNDGTPMEDILGYSIVNRSGPTCTTSNYSMAHELGHSMGTRHDRASDGAENNNSQQNYGHFNLNANERTIMATEHSCSGCARIGYWSNLSLQLSYSNGATPMGSANPDNAANNAGTLDSNKSTVAGWKTRPSTTCKNATGTDTTSPSSPTSLSIQ